MNTEFVVMMLMSDVKEDRTILYNCANTEEDMIELLWIIACMHLCTVSFLAGACRAQMYVTVEENDICTQFLDHIGEYIQGNLQSLMKEISNSYGR